MTKPSPLLPGLSWKDDEYVTTSKKTKLRRWGNVAAACKILDDCDREVIYHLLSTKEISGYKLRPKRANSHWKVNLMSVWEHKQKQLKAD